MGGGPKGEGDMDSKFVILMVKVKEIFSWVETYPPSPLPAYGPVATLYKATSTSFISRLDWLPFE